MVEQGESRTVMRRFRRADVQQQSAPVETVTLLPNREEVVVPEEPNDRVKKEQKSEAAFQGTPEEEKIFNPEGMQFGNTSATYRFS